MTRRTPGYSLLLVLLTTFSACAQNNSIAVTTSPEFGSKLNAAVNDGTFRKITSVVVSKSGKPLHESYWGTGNPEMLNDTRSAMKSLTAMAVGAAIDDGHISSVNLPALSYFESDYPGLKANPAAKTITIRDLLTMSSAFDCNDNNPDSPGNEENMYGKESWTQFALSIPVKPDYQRDNNGYGPFSYCTAGSFLLGQIIQRATGKPVDVYIEDRILKPLEISRIRWDRSPSDEVMTGGGAELKSRDLLKLGEMVLGKGEYNGVKVLTAEWVAEMISAHVSAREAQNYGYQWWLEDFTCGDASVSGWYMSGNGGNKIAVFAELDLVVVVTAQLYGTRGMHQQSTDIIEQYVLASMPDCRESTR